MKIGQDLVPEVGSRGRHRIGDCAERSGLEAPVCSPDTAQPQAVMKAGRISSASSSENSTFETSSTAARPPPPAICYTPIDPISTLPVGRMRSRRTLAATKRPPPPAETPGESGHPSVIEVILAYGFIPTFLFALGVAVIPLWFWGAIGLIALSLPFTVWLSVKVFRHNTKLTLKIMLAGVSLLLYVGAYWSIWVPASISPVLADNHVNYETGTDIYGITWQPDFSEVQLHLSNDSDYDYTNIDAYVRTDLLIAGAGLFGGINICSSEPYSGIPVISGTVSWKGSQGDPHTAPLLENNLRQASFFRIRCDRFSARSVIDIRFAVIALPPVITRQEPQWAKLWLSFNAGYRPVHLSPQSCFVTQCDNIPDQLP
jgi:hypothetical protein